MKAVLLLMLLIPGLTSFAQTKDTLHWQNDYQLTWDDFQGIPNDSVNGAITTTGIYCHSYRDIDKMLIFIVDNVFDKKESWVKPISRNIYSLNHEQGHFNITEIYARKLRQEFKNFKMTTNNTLAVNEIYNKIKKEWEDMERLYDQETTHPHIDSIKQKQWNNKISNWLKSK